MILNYAAWAMSHLGAWGLLLLAAFVTGDLFLRQARFHSRLERLVFTLALGLGVTSLGWLGLGFVGLLSRPVIWGLTLVVDVYGLWRLIGPHAQQSSMFVRLLRALRLSAENAWQHKLQVGLMLFSLAYAGFLLLLTQYPPVQWDATASHLVVAREYLNNQRVTVVEGVSAPIVPALNHLLFTWALALRDDILAQMVEYTFLLLTALGLWAWGERQGRSSWGLALGLFWLSHPLVLWTGLSCYIDVSLTCFVFLGLYALAVFREQAEVSWLKLGIVLLALAAGCKITGLFFLGLGSLYAAWAIWRARLGWQTLAMVAVGALLAAAPWYAFIAYHTGNPIWPMFPQWSRAEWVGAGATGFSGFLQAVGPPKTLLNFLKLPFYLAAKQPIFFQDNQQGYLWLVAFYPLAWVAAVWHTRLRWWVFWLTAYTAFWFATAAYLRYLMPAIPLVGICLYEVAHWLLSKVTKTAVLRQGVWLVVSLMTVGWGLRGLALGNGAGHAWPPVTATERAALLSKVYGFVGAQYVSQHARPAETVYILNGYYITYHVRARVIGFYGAQVDRATNTLVWPAESWRQVIAHRQPNWLLVVHGGCQPPQEPLFKQAGQPVYELVFSDSQTFVFRLLPRSGS